MSAFLGAAIALPMTNVLDLAPGIPINDGNVHRIGDAPPWSVFYGVTTLASLAAIKIGWLFPFAFLTNNITYANGENYTTIFTSSTGYFKYTDSIVQHLNISLLAHQAGVILGPLRIPPGVYVHASSTDTVLLPGTLMIPPCVDSGGISAANSGNTQIHIEGDGNTATIITVTRDLNPAAAVASITWANGVATVNTVVPHGLTTGLLLNFFLLGFSSAVLNKAPRDATITGPSTFTFPILYNFGTQSVIGQYVFPGLNGILCCGDPAATFVQGNTVGRYGPYQFYGDLINIQVVGTGIWNFISSGVQGSYTSGLLWGSRLRTTNFLPYACYAGYDFVGDHTYLRGLHTQDCYYGVYFSGPGQTQGITVGDIQADDILISGCFAAFAAGCLVTIVIQSSDEFYLGSNNIIFYGEAGSASNPQPIMAASFFRSWSFEGYSNAIVFDQNALALDATGAWVYTDANKKRSCWARVGSFAAGTYWSTSNVPLTINGQSLRALFDCADLNLHIDYVLDANFFYSASIAPSLAVFNVNGISELRLGGNCLAMFQTATDANIPFIITQNYEKSNASWLDTQSSIGGLFFSTLTSGNYPTTIIGDLFELSGNYSNIQPAGSNLIIANAPFVGSCMEGGLTLGSKQLVPIATKGPSIQVNIGSQAPAMGLIYQKATGIGALLTITPGTSTAAASGTWVSSGGGATTNASGTWAASGTTGITSWTITNHGAGMTSAPTIALTATSGSVPSGGALTPHWPSALATPGVSANFGNTLGVSIYYGGSAPNNHVNLYLQ
jgi:hypothetical protein